MANGKIIYYPDGETPTTYEFEHNYDYGHGMGPVDLLCRKRALSGKAWVMLASKKGSWTLPFTSVPQSQFDAFQAAFNGYLVELYLDKNLPKTADVFFAAAPRLISEPYFDENGDWVCDFIAELEEM